jgi:pilus assembly protein Flp/PilA
MVADAFCLAAVLGVIAGNKGFGDERCSEERGFPVNGENGFMKKFCIRSLVTFLRDDQGQDLVEYALIVAAVGLALITTVNTLSQGVAALYSNITTELTSIGAAQQ